jgi:hypothetical protein
MHGFNDSSVNWTDSASVGSHYDAMIKRYLKKKNQTDFSKFEFALHGYNPVFSKWEYTDIPKPCINRIKKLSNNSFEFDLEQTVEFSNSNINIVRSQYIRIKTSENDNFKSETNFKTPLVGYTVSRTQSTTSSSTRAPDIVHIILNPMKVEKKVNKWYFFYNIFANKTCKVNVRFQMKYEYQSIDDDADASSEDSPTVAVVSTNVGNDELPVVEESTLLKTDVFDDDDDSIEPTLTRSSSLRSSLRTVHPPTQLKDEFKTNEPNASNSNPTVNKVFYELDEKTQKRLNKKK